MFYIIYNTTSKFIIAASHNNSTGVSETLQNHLATFVKLNKFNASEFSAIELPYDEDLVVVIGRDMFDAETNTIIADPNWVPPTPDPVPSQGTPA